MAWLRRATTRAPSARESAPATQAAAISPWEWPMTAAGRTPWERHTSASDTMIAHSTGWTTSTRSSGCRARTVSMRSQSVTGARAAAQSAMCAANTGEVSSRSAAIPAHWEPWPGKTKAIRDSAAGLPRTTFGAVPPSARAVRPAVRAGRSAPVTTARSVSAARPVARVWATSGTGSVPVVRWSSRLRAWAARPCSPWPDSTSGSGPVQAGSCARASGSGAASTMTWALVPLMPVSYTHL